MKTTSIIYNICINFWNMASWTSLVSDAYAQMILHFITYCTQADTQELNQLDQILW